MYKQVPAKNISADPNFQSYFFAFICLSYKVHAK